MDIKLSKYIKEAIEAEPQASAESSGNDNRVSQLTALLDKQPMNQKIFGYIQKLTSSQKVKILTWFCEKLSIRPDVLTITASKLKQSN